MELAVQELRPASKATFADVALQSLSQARARTAPHSRRKRPARGAASPSPERPKTATSPVPSEEAGASGLARCFRRQCEALLPLGCCPEDLRMALWQLITYVLSRAFAGSLDARALCAALNSGFSNDPNVDEATRTPTRAPVEADEALSEGGEEWTGRYGARPAALRATW